MLPNKYAAMPTEAVPVTQIQKGDVIMEDGHPPRRVLQPPIKKLRPRNQSSIIPTLPPANGVPVKPTQYFLMVKSVFTIALQGHKFAGPYLAEDTVTRVVE